MVITLDDIQLSNCKRQHTDGDDFVSLLSRRGAMKDVWIVLNRFPLCNQNHNAIAEVRGSGQLRRHIEAECPHLTKPYGPETREEWIELAQVAIWVACGVQVAPETLCIGHCFRWYPSNRSGCQWKLGHPDNLRRQAKETGTIPTWHPESGLTWEKPN